MAALTRCGERPLGCCSLLSFSPGDEHRRFGTLRLIEKRLASIDSINAKLALGQWRLIPVCLAALLLLPGMELAVRLLQVGDGQPQIPLGGRQRLVAEHFLNVPQVGVVL